MSAPPSTNWIAEAVGWGIGLITPMVFVVLYFLQGFRPCVSVLRDKHNTQLKIRIHNKGRLGGEVLEVSVLDTGGKPPKKKHPSKVLDQVGFQPFHDLKFEAGYLGPNEMAILIASRSQGFPEPLPYVRIRFTDKVKDIKPKISNYGFRTKEARLPHGWK